MVSRQNVIWFVSGFAASALVGLVWQPAPALAQSTLTNVTPPAARKNVPPRRVPVPIPTDADDDAPTPPPTTVRPPDDPDADPAPNGDPQDGDDQNRINARRNIDGEPQAGTEQPIEQDGLLPVGEVAPSIRDGESDLNRDPRLKSDIDAFEKPSAGYDAVAFQIELDPILDRRPARLARFEPYDPIGIKRGSWIIFPEVEFGMGRTSNIRRSPNSESANIFDARPTVRAITNWRQHAIELRATGFGSAVQGFASENDRAYALEARGRLDFSRNTNLEVLVSTQKDQEARQARDALDSSRERADIVTTRAAMALNHRINRLSLQLRGAITDANYEPVTTVGGLVASNDQRDVTERSTAVRATWEFKPTLLAFTELALNDRAYAGASGDGIKRDSHGYRAITGISFGNTGRTWRGELSAGYGEQKPDDYRLTSVGGFLFNANLTWRVSELTSLAFNASTEFNDSTTVGQGGATVRTAGIEARHAFRRHLIGTAAVRHATTSYSGTSLTEAESTGELGVEYFLNRTTTLSARYNHVIFNSSAPAADYTVDSVRFGVRVRQ